jgi:RNA-directed DNA polymerase
MAHSGNSWHSIAWKDVIQEVRRMQAALVKADQAGESQRVRDLQDQIVRSRAAKLLAIRQVTSTGGKRTPGIDGELWNTPERKMAAVDQLDCTDYQPQPARRVAIPKENGRVRPVSILTMNDRAMQALYLFALDPIAETRADPHSYGFRKYRSAADAIGYCEEIFLQDGQSRWILEADIERCFETISHEWLLHHIPLDQAVLRGWLTAGCLEGGQVYPQTQGLPQGGILSPTLANMTLDGLEPLLEIEATRKRRSTPVYVIRYADDFLVLHASKRTLRQMIQPQIEAFLQARGMRLSTEKTRITQAKQGWEFLGYRLQWKRGKLMIAPSKKGFVKVAARIEQIIRAYPLASPAEMICLLSPIIRGWAGYYRGLDDRRLFLELDRRVMKWLWEWAKARHTGVWKRRRARRYFTAGSGGLPRLTDGDGQTIFYAQDTPCIRHIPIDPACNPYDLAWKPYLRQRQQAKQPAQEETTEDGVNPTLLVC